MIAGQAMSAGTEVERNGSASGLVPGQVDAMLVARARRMDEAAWREIVEMHYQRLSAYLQRRTGSAATAEDLTSQVFTEAVAGIDRYEWRGLPFATWLFRIARNLSADYHRAGVRREGPLIDAAVQHEELQRLERDVEREHVRMALRDLTDEQRQVLELRFIEEFSIAETAAIIGKTEGATKAIQHRALVAMRRILQQIDPHTWRLNHGHANR